GDPRDPAAVHFSLRLAGTLDRRVSYLLRSHEQDVRRARRPEAGCLQRRLARAHGESQPFGRPHAGVAQRIPRSCYRADIASLETHMRTWSRRAAAATLSAAGILMVTMGARQSLGLFVSPLNSSTGLGITTISFALAVGQLMWGAIQPVAGAVADRYGPGKVLVAGLVVLSIGTALTPFMTSGFGLVVALGVLAAVGSGAGSFSVLIGAAAPRLTEDRRGKAAGIINAGGSLGQFVFAPISQALIQTLGWMGAMWSLALITLGAL